MPQFVYQNEENPLYKSSYYLAEKGQVSINVDAYAPNFYVLARAAGVAKKKAVIEATQTAVAIFKLQSKKNYYSSAPKQMMPKLFNITGRMLNKFQFKNPGMTVELAVLYVSEKGWWAGSCGTNRIYNLHTRRFSRVIPVNLDRSRTTKLLGENKYGDIEFAMGESIIGDRFMLCNPELANTINEKKIEVYLRSSGKIEELPQIIIKEAFHRRKQGSYALIMVEKIADQIRFTPRQYLYQI